jgi:hypothetical protein
LAPQPCAVQSPSRGNFYVAGSCRVSGVRLIIGDHDATQPRGVVAPGAGVVGVAEPVVHGIEVQPEHYWVGYTGEIPLLIPMRSGGRQLVGGALGRLVAGGGARVPSDRDMAAGVSPARCRVGVGGGDVRRRAPCRPMGKRGPETEHSPAGATVVSPEGALCCEATRAACRRSDRACRERWPERRRRRGAEGPASSVLAGVGVATMHATATGSVPAWHRARSSSRLVRRMR